MDAKKLYDTLRNLGPIAADKVPEEIVKQAKDAGFYIGTNDGCREAISVLAKAAVAHGSADSWALAVTSGALNTPDSPKGRLNVDASMMRAGYGGQDGCIVSGS